MQTRRYDMTLLLLHITAIGYDGTTSGVCYRTGIFDVWGKVMGGGGCKQVRISTFYYLYCLAIIASLFRVTPGWQTMSSLRTDRNLIEYVLKWLACCLVVLETAC